MENEIIVYKPNELIEIVGNPIPPVALLTYNYVLHKFKKEKTDKLIFSVAEVFTSLNISDNYSSIYDYLESLRTTSVISKDKKGKVWGAFSLLSEYKKVDGGVFIQIPDTIFKALNTDEESESKNLYYTAIKLLEQKAFKNIHTLVFYEIFKKYEKINIPLFTVNDLRQFTNTVNKYSTYADFKRYVIEKSLEKINKIDKIYKYTFEEERLGRKVNKIKFMKEEKVANEIKTEEFSKKIIKAIEIARKNRFIDISYSHRSMKTILAKYDEENILKALREAYKYNSEIINFSKFMISKIKDIQDSKKEKVIPIPKEVVGIKEISKLDILKGEIARFLMKSNKFKLIEKLETLKSMEEIENFKSKIKF